MSFNAHCGALKPEGPNRSYDLTREANIDRMDLICGGQDSDPDRACARHGTKHRSVPFCQRRIRQGPALSGGLEKSPMTTGN
jgi:hypothetical protein